MNNTKNELSAQEAFFRSGVGHCNAALIIHDHLNSISLPHEDSTWIALSHVLGFATEASLKAYLASHGMDRKTLQKQYGHNLKALFDKAMEFELHSQSINISQPHLTSELAKYISETGDDYASYNYRYILSPEVTNIYDFKAVRTLIVILRYILDFSNGGAKELYVIG